MKGGAPNIKLNWVRSPKSQKDNKRQNGCGIPEATMIRGPRSHQQGSHAIKTTEQHGPKGLPGKKRRGRNLERGTRSWKANGDLHEQKETRPTNPQGLKKKKKTTMLRIALKEENSWRGFTARLDKPYLVTSETPPMYSNKYPTGNWLSKGERDRCQSRVPWMSHMGFVLHVS